MYHSHKFRSINDGLQPWFANRLKFGLGTYKCQSMKDTEEGLASLNTAFESKVKYIWGPAMLYCKLHFFYLPFRCSNT